jgi:hypothetical protein
MSTTTEGALHNVGNATESESATTPLGAGVRPKATDSVSLEPRVLVEGEGDAVIVTSSGEMDTRAKVGSAKASDGTSDGGGDTDDTAVPSAGTIAEDPASTPEKASGDAIAAGKAPGSGARGSGGGGGSGAGDGQEEQDDGGDDGGGYNAPPVELGFAEQAEWDALLHRVRWIFLQ